MSVTQWVISATRARSAGVPLSRLSFLASVLHRYSSFFICICSPFRYSLSRSNKWNKIKISLRHLWVPYLLLALWIFFFFIIVLRVWGPGIRVNVRNKKKQSICERLDRMIYYNTNRSRKACVLVSYKPLAESQDTRGLYSLRWPIEMFPLIFHLHKGPIESLIVPHAPYSPPVFYISSHPQRLYTFSYSSSCSLWFLTLLLVS